MNTQWQLSAQVQNYKYVQLVTRETFQLICFSRAGERRKRGKTDRRSTELSTIIRNCLEQTILLELMPSSQIDVYVQVLQVSRSHTLHYQCVMCAAPSTLQCSLSQQCFAYTDTDSTSVSETSLAASYPRSDVCGWIEKAKTCSSCLYLMHQIP